MPSIRQDNGQPSPGQVAYESYAALILEAAPPLPPGLLWADLNPRDQASWEVIAVAGAIAAVAVAEPGPPSGGTEDAAVIAARVTGPDTFRCLVCFGEFPAAERAAGRDEDICAGCEPSVTWLSRCPVCRCPDVHPAGGYPLHERTCTMTSTGLSAITSEGPTA